MKKTLIFLIFGALGFSNTLWAEDLKHDFKFTDGTIEKVLVWEKLTECAGFAYGASFYVGKNDIDKGDLFNSRADDFFYLGKEQIKLDRNISDDDAITIMSDKMYLEQNATEETIAYYQGQISSSGSKAAENKANLQKYLHTNYFACDAFATAIIN